ncbi:hypothetical protein AMBAS45_15590 [Alteromonas macleodii str. 'Balearic Sea AD45']|uniref:hypothetical protein n=1 Tax=Alteromonas macleodii TaxID=28108 RepID=UPI000286FB75|nr:hypothetical protein [Alteromonas macleodii]AFT96581.1 hypothetical protein AMBAS45_15590 [Alteromonas macleodii str. 'Balearic Sea AD45']MCG8498774.1 hypothetical protein [Enterobacterales bacterium]MCZ4240848.1 hypothetical protein [Alteromonas macleodii]
MQSIEELKRVSHFTRIMLFAVVGIFLSIAIYGFVLQGQWWVTFGGHQFDALWLQYEESQFLLATIFSPLIGSWLLGFYFLQHLLLALSRGLFYAKTTLRHLKFVSWITVFYVCYKMLMTPLATYLVVPSSSIDISLNPMTIIIVLCLPVLVHIFSAAAELDKENKEIV